VPKFEMPPIIQFFASAIVGMLAGGFVTVVVFGASEVWAAWRGRSRRW
jgi:hypothetical protein